MTEAQRRARIAVDSRPNPDSTKTSFFEKFVKDNLGFHAPHEKILNNWEEAMENAEAVAVMQVQSNMVKDSDI